MNKISGAAWFGRVIVAGFGVFVLGAPASLCGAASDPVDIAAYRIASTVAESVAIVLREAPQDERGLVMIGNRLDDVVVKSIQQSPASAHALVAEVAAHYPLSANTQDYIAKALIGFSQICEDFPPPSDREIDPTLLELITAFRHGVKAGAETARHSADV